MTFFNRAACFTDIHFGNKNNSKQHNRDCADFVDWFIEQSEDCETCIFLGDWHHHRSSVNVSTLNHSVENVGKLSRAFKQVYMIMGNHDLYYREKRDLNSLPYAGLFDNVTLVEDMLVQDDIALVPWLVGDEWKNLQKTKCRPLSASFLGVVLSFFKKVGRRLLLFDLGFLFAVFLGSLMETNPCLNLLLLKFEFHHSCLPPHQ